MKPTPKADECIKMIKEISFIADTLHICFDNKLTDEKIEKYKAKGKLDLLLSVEKDNFENFKKRINEITFISWFRFLPMGNLNHNGSTCFKNLREDEWENIIQSALKNTNVESHEVEQFRLTLMLYNEITIDNLKAEFWEISDDIHSFDKSYQIMKYKFKDIYSKIPNPDYYEFSHLMTEPFIKEHIDNLVKHDIATFAEAEKIILRISNVVGELNRKTNRVVELYKSFIEDYPTSDIGASNTSQKTATEKMQNAKTQLPPELDTPEAEKLFSKVSQCQFDGSLYSWSGTYALFGYFVDEASRILEIRPSNDRIPWKLFKSAFQMTDKNINTARQAVNQYTNKDGRKPEGFIELNLELKSE